MKCFIIAMEKEAAPLLSALKCENNQIICGKKTFVGTLFGERIGLVICGVGKVNAALGTQLAIDKLDADTVINLGVAGGLNSHLTIGRLYAVSEAVQYDFDLTQINGTPMGTLDECKTNYLPLSRSDAYPLKKIATGDRFNDDIADHTLLTKVLSADMRDMECGAVAQVCLHAKIKCYAFKIISDVWGSLSTIEQYKENFKLCLKTLSSELENIIGSLK